MKLNKWFMGIVILTLLFFLISYVSSKYITYKEREVYPISIMQSYLKSFGGVDQIYLKKSFPVTAINELDVQAIDADVQVKTSSSENIIVSMTGKVFNNKNPQTILVQKINGTKLILSTSEQNANNHSRFEGNLVIAIPEKIANLSIATQRGDAVVKVPRLQSLNFNTQAGDFVANNTSIDDVTINTVSGDISFEGNVRKLAIRVVSGDANINLLNSDPILSYNSVSGDIKLSVTKPNLTLSFVSVKGSFSAGEFGVQNKKTMPIHFGQGNGKVYVNTVSGDFFMKNDAEK